MDDGVAMTKHEKPKRLGRARLMLGRLARAEDGIAAVEFALVGPVLILMIMGVIEGGRLFWMQSSLQYQVEELGRYAMTQYTREYYTLCDPALDPPPLATCADSLLDTVEATADTKSDQNTVGWNLSGVTWTTTQETGTPDYLLIRGTSSFTPLFGIIPGITMPLESVTRVPMVKFD